MGFQISQLVSWTTRKALAECEVLVSFADQTQRHVGFIYQASGWAYHGLRERRMDGLIVDGTFVPGRTCNSVYGTRSPDLLRSRMPNADIQPHFDEGKHLYWKSNNRKRIELLGLQSKPYPKAINHG